MRGSERPRLGPAGEHDGGGWIGSALTGNRSCSTLTFLTNLAKGNLKAVASEEDEEWRHVQSSAGYDDDDCSGGVTSRMRRCGRSFWGRWG